MKRLIVMRHAKSDWDAEAPTDHARPLNKRGRHDAPRVAAKLVELAWQPTHVLSSDAQRTRETFELMTLSFEPPPTVEYLELLYHAGPDHLAGPIGTLSNETETALVLGHNPGWEQAVYWLTRKAVRLTTANAVLIESDVDLWSDVVRHAGNWHIKDIIRPKEI